MNMNMNMRYRVMRVFGYPLLRYEVQVLFLGDWVYETATLTKWGAKRKITQMQKASQRENYVVWESD